MTRRSKYKPTVQGREIKVGDTLYNGEGRNVIALQVFKIEGDLVETEDEHQIVHYITSGRIDRRGLFWAEAEAVEFSTKYMAMHYAVGALHDAYTCVCSLSHHSITVDTATKIRQLTEELSKVVEQARKEIKQCP